MPSTKQASLESLIEMEDLGLEVLHPGGLRTTQQLAAMCGIRQGTKVLDVASGTGEGACYLTEAFGARVVGVDASPSMVARATQKAEARGLPVTFQQADAHQLPFDNEVFDVVISECTTSLLHKERALREMARVAKPGGYVGIHDLCWKEGAPERVKRKLAEIEGERPETLQGWTALFEAAGLRDVQTEDRSYLVPAWMKEDRKSIGIGNQLRISLKVIRRWGVGGLLRILQSERLFRSEHLGYVIVVGRKP